MLTEQEFDEKYYLAKNPDVAEAVKRGNLKSGYEHFKNFGEKERRAFRAVSLRSAWQHGFSEVADRLAFYSLVERADFVQLVSSPDFKGVLESEIGELSPKFVLESLE